MLQGGPNGVLDPATARYPRRRRRCRLHLSHTLGSTGRRFPHRPVDGGEDPWMVNPDVDDDGRMVGPEVLDAARRLPAAPLLNLPDTLWVIATQRSGMQDGWMSAGQGRRSWQEPRRVRASPLLVNQGRSRRVTPRETRRPLFAQPLEESSIRRGTAGGPALFPRPLNHTVLRTRHTTLYGDAPLPRIHRRSL